MSDYKLAIIGGSGLYEIEDIEESRWEKIETPWGLPSDELLTFKYKKIRSRLDTS